MSDIENNQVKNGRLAGKRILVTGAGGKMGEHFVRAFAEQGADLVLTTRTVSKLAGIVEELRGAGTRVVSIGADFTCDTDIVQLAEEAWKAFDGIDVVLLSSQPAEPRMGDVLSTSMEQYVDQQQSIVWGPLLLLKHLLPKMGAAGGGSLISIISSTGYEPTRGHGAYGLAKGSLELLTRYVAVEYGQQGIRANCISPGMIATGGTGAVQAGAQPTSMLARTALARTGSNSEVVGAAVYFASDESSFTSGQRLCVNGGRV